MPQGSVTLDDKATATQPNTGRRRPPTDPAEQERRVAWGTRWGKVSTEAGRQIKEDDAA